MTAARVQRGDRSLIEQGGTGDAVMHWNLAGGQYYSAGIDNSRRRQV